MRHVFITYAHQDQAFVGRLAADLRQAGAEVWFDQVSMVAGAEWSSSIQQAIAEASAVLYVSTRAGNASRWVASEISAAIALRIPVIPLIVDEPPASAVLRTLQWIDFRADYRAALEHLIARLPTISLRHEALPPQTPKSRGYVFISYADQDSSFVSRLRGFLKERGYGYWDYQASDRNYHGQFSIELEEIIQGAAATLSILSPDWKRSKWAAKEYLFSEDVGIPVFLLRIRDMGPTLVTAGVPYIDFVGDIDEAFTKLDHELRRKGLV